MEKMEIGSFYARTVFGRQIEFIVYDDYTMACPDLEFDTIYRLYIKPRFVLKVDYGYYTYYQPNCKHPELIVNYDIDEDLFRFLKVNEMISYSVDMAYLYGFEDTNGYDVERKEGSPYKWAKKKGPILSRQKRGFFN